MDHRYAWTKITRSDFHRVRELYPTVLAEKLRELDQKRRRDVPETLRKRRDGEDGGGGKEAGGAYLTTDEVTTLVRWKLSHGTFRPRLLALAASNTTTPTVTRTALALVSRPGDAAPTTDSVLAAIRHLSAHLAGIGPATASLLLAAWRPDAVPFFGDEVFRWVMFDSDDDDKDQDEAAASRGPVKGGKGGKGGKGTGGVWDLKIGYTVKEYGMLLERVGKLRARLGVEAWEAEDVAYVLGRTGGDLEGLDDGAKGEAEGKAQGEGEGEAKEEADREEVRAVDKEVESDENEVKTDFVEEKKKRQPTETTARSRRKAPSDDQVKGAGSKGKAETARAAESREDEVDGAISGTRRRSKRLRTES